MINLNSKTYLAIGGVLLGLVYLVQDSGLVPPEYAGIVGTISTALALAMGRTPRPTPPVQAEEQAYTSDAPAETLRHPLESPVRVDPWDECPEDDEDSESDDPCAPAPMRPRGKP